VPTTGKIRRRFTLQVSPRSILSLAYLPLLHTHLLVASCWGPSLLLLDLASLQSSPSATTLSAEDLCPYVIRRISGTNTGLRHAGLVTSTAFMVVKGAVVVGGVGGKLMMVQSSPPLTLK